MKYNAQLLARVPVRTGRARARAAHAARPRGGRAAATRGRGPGGRAAAADQLLPPRERPERRHAPRACQLLPRHLAAHARSASCLHDLPAMHHWPPLTLGDEPAAPNQQQQPKTSLAVALDSELLVMESKPTEASSSFLLLTVSGRPESGDGARHSTIVVGRSADGRGHADGGKRKPTKASVASPTRQTRALKSNNQQESPPKEPKVAWSSKVQGLAQGHAVPQPTRIHPTQQLNAPVDALAASVAGRSTPARVFKMDRFRVVTPAFASANAHQNLTTDPG